MSKYLCFIFLYLLTVRSVFAQKDSLKTQNLNEVVVKSTRVQSNAAVAFTDVFQTDIKKVNLGQDVPYLLAQLPSVVVSSDAGTGVGYTGIRIRGTDPTRINVTLNGIPYNDSESQGVYWVDMPDFASSIQSIQVQRGVGTSTNGAGAFGGSININTMQLHREAYSELNNTVGSFGTIKNNLLMSTGLLNNHFVFDGRISRIASNGFVDRATSNLKSFYVSGAYYSNNSFLRLNVFSGHERTYQSWYGIPEALAKGDVSGVNDFAIRNGYDDVFTKDMLARGRRYNFYDYPNQVDDYTQSHFQLISSLKLSKNWRFNPSFFYSKGKGYYEEYLKNQNLVLYGFNNLVEITDKTPISDLISRKWLDNDFYGTVWALDYEGNSKFKTSFGGGYNKYVGGHFGEVLWTQLAPTIFLNPKYYDNISHKRDFNLYAKSTYSINNKLDAFLDIQGRWVNFDMNGLTEKNQTLDFSKNYNFLNPKIGISFKIKRNALLYASHGVGNKEPSRQDFVDNATNVPLSENLQDTEIGMRWQQNNWKFEVNGYYMNYHNQLVLTGKINAVGDAIRTNVAQSHRAGIELQATGKISERLKVDANVTISQNKIKNFVETVPNYDSDKDQVNHFVNSDISFSPNVICGGQLTYQLTKRMEIAWLPKYVGKQYLDNTSNEARKLDGFFVNNLRWSYGISNKYFKDLNFSLLINNVLDKKYQSNGYSYTYIYGTKITENFVYPQAGINFLAAVRMRF